MDSQDNVRLERVALHHGAAYVAMVVEHLASIEGYPYNNYPLAQVDFAAFVQELNDEAQGIGLPDGIPPQRTYVLVTTGDVVVGEFRLRTELKPPYDQYGGHIGYNIRPTYRRQGHATRGLALLLDQARDAGLAEVCLMVDEENLASQRVIGRNGGVITHYVAPDYRGLTTVCYGIGL